jgi:hypothetical protein
VHNRQLRLLQHTTAAAHVEPCCFYYCTDSLLSALPLCAVALYCTVMYVCRVWLLALLMKEAAVLLLTLFQGLYISNYSAYYCILLCFTVCITRTCCIYYALRYTSTSMMLVLNILHYVLNILHSTSMHTILAMHCAPLVIKMYSHQSLLVNLKAYCWYSIV